MPNSGDEASTFLVVLQRQYRRLLRFIMRDLWVLELAALSTAKRCLLYPLRVLLIALNGFFFDHQCVMRSAALSYTTLSPLCLLLYLCLSQRAWGETSRAVAGLNLSAGSEGDPANHCLRQ